MKKQISFIIIFLFLTTNIVFSATSLNESEIKIRSLNTISSENNLKIQEIKPIVIGPKELPKITPPTSPPPKRYLEVQKEKIHFFDKIWNWILNLFNK